LHALNRTVVELVNFILREKEQLLTILLSMQLSSFISVKLELSIMSRF
jgi:hypothetical protein